uniref:Uncharacterized protein n=1 Tax=viral metagenome TaxID=1070528 RepID=A0A6H1ZNJ3_9ZZZZ
MPCRESYIRKYVAVHKEFDKNHKVITTIFKKISGKESLEECQRWCDRANANGFNYFPYKETDI